MCDRCDVGGRGMGEMGGGMGRWGNGGMGGWENGGMGSEGSTVGIAAGDDANVLFAKCSPAIISVKCSL